MIIEWPKSQICMDCVFACWLADNKEKKSIVYPAVVCEQNFSFNGDECPHRVDICDALSVELVPVGKFLWDCPGCGKSNREKNQKAKVTCKSCERTFSVSKSENRNQSAVG